MKNNIAIVLVLVILSAGCRPSDKINKAVGITKATLENTRWALTELRAETITLENKPYLMFAKKEHGGKWFWWLQSTGWFV
jgi:hypothetical protein